MKLKKVVIALAIVQLAGSALAAEKLTGDQAQIAMIRGSCEAFATTIDKSTFANTPEKLAAAFEALRLRLNVPPKALPVRQASASNLHEMAFEGCRDFMLDMYGVVETDKTRRELAGLSR